MDTITPSSLAKTDPIKYNVPTDTTNYQSIISDTIASIPKLQIDVTNAQNQQDTAITDYLKTLEVPSLTDITAQQNTANNIDTLTQQANTSQAKLRELSAQGDVLTRQAQVIPLQVQQQATGQGVTDRGIAPIQTGLLRENAIKALTIASQADIARAVAQNDIASLNTATEKANKAIDLQYKDQQIKQENALKNLELISTYKLSPKQKELLDAKKFQMEYAQEQIKQEVADKKTISDMVISAIAQGANTAGVDTAKAAQAKTPLEAAQILGEYAGDYFRTQELKKKLKDLNAGNYTTAPIGSLTKESGFTIDDYLRGISGTESGGNEEPYKTLGPVLSSGAYKGDRAYGKYQVMGKNIPQWTKEAFGVAMTPEEFLNSPEKQDALIRFRAEKDYAKYGNWDDVASVWFSGKPAKGNTAADALGTTVPDYLYKLRKFAGVSTTSNLSSSEQSFVDLFNQGQYKDAAALDIAMQRSDLSTESKNRVRQAIATNANPVVGIGSPQVSKITNNIDMLSKVLNDGSYKSVSGNIQTGKAFGILNMQKGDTLSAYNSILSSDTLNQLANAKANGITFGALSDGERDLVAAAANTLSTAKKPDGKGFNMSEAKFKEQSQIVLDGLKRIALSKVGVKTDTIQQNSANFAKINELYNNTFSGSGIVSSQIDEADRILQNTQTNASISGFNFK